MEEKKKLNFKIIIPIVIAIVVVAVIGIVIYMSKNNNTKEKNNNEVETKSDVNEKTKFLNQATILDIDKLKNETEANEARAKQEYEDKIFILTTTVNDISEYYFTTNNNIDVYLKNKDELITINKRDDIIIVGKLVGVGTFSVRMISAYIITDEPNLIWAPVKESTYSTTREYYDYTYNDDGVITGYKESGNGYPRHIYIRV